MITTASVPGRIAPRIIDRSTVEKMKPGAVIIDLASDSGGNCEVTEPGRSVTIGRVKVLGFTDLPSMVPVNASEMFSRNAVEFMKLLIHDGQLADTFGDEILMATKIGPENKPEGMV